MATTTFINLIKADPADNEANLGEIATSPTTGGVHVSLDIAAMLNALLWPTVLFVIFIKFRKEIPALLKGVAGRIKKLEFWGVSIELGVAKAFVPNWSEATGALDLRQKASSVRVNDSLAI